jgi:hypothetical protein
MSEDGLEKDLLYKIDEHIKKEIESATEIYHKTIEFHQKQFDNVWKLNRYLLGIVIAATIGFLYFIFSQSLPSMEQRLSNELNIKLKDKLGDENVQRLIKETVTSFTAEQVEKGYYELLELSVSISQAFWDIDSLRFLAKVIKNPNYPYPKFMNLAKKNYDDVRKVIRDRNYADYDDPENCGLNADLLRQGKKNDFLTQIKGLIRERSRSSALFCLVLLWGNKNISKEEKLAVSYEMLLNATDPFAIHYTCMQVETEGEANLKKDFLLETDEYIKWLEKYK